MDSTGKEISVGNAAKIASELTAFCLNTGADPDAVVEVYGDILEKVAARIISTSEAATGGAPAGFAPATPQQTQALQHAFPGSQVQAAPAPAAPFQQPQVVAPPSNVVPFPQQAAPAPQFGGPAPVPGVAPATDGDPETANYWTMFFNDIANGTWVNNWEDNRATKKGEKSPDFKHRTLKDSGGKYKASLWINGPKNPSWVAGQLAAARVV